MIFKTLADQITFFEKVLETSKEPEFTSTCIIVMGSFELRHLRGPWVAMREDELYIEFILVNPVQGFDMRVAPAGSLGFECGFRHFDLERGQIGHIWGAKVFEVKDVPERTLIFVGRKTGKNVTDEFKVGVLHL